MDLPRSVAACMDALEQAGYSAFAVGGCVRDSLLGISPHDYDLCTSALPEEICRVFAQHSLVRSGEKHGTIGVVTQTIGEKWGNPRTLNEAVPLRINNLRTWG